MIPVLSDNPARRASFSPAWRATPQRRRPARQIGAEGGGVGVVGFIGQGLFRRRQGARQRCSGVKGLGRFFHDPVMHRPPTARSAQSREFCVGGAL